MIDNFDELIDQTENDLNIATNNFIKLLKAQANEEIIEELEYYKNRCSDYENRYKIEQENTKSLRDQVAEYENKFTEDKITKVILNGCKNLDEERFDKLLEAIFTPKFPRLRLDDEYPSWVYFICKYYDNRDYVIQMLKQFNFIKYPDNIDKFRLPIDWNEEEIDYFIEHMGKNVVCNQAYYDWGNLRWWYFKATESVSEMYNDIFSEIPYQYVFMNQLTNTKERLARLAVRVAKHNDTQILEGIKHWMKPEEENLKFFIDTLITELKEEAAKVGSRYSIPNLILDFLYAKIDLIEDEWIHKELFNHYIHGWSNLKDVLKFPGKYLIRWVNLKSENIGVVLASPDLSARFKKRILDIISNDLDAQIGDETNE